MVSIQEYADKQKVSYEAVRKQVKRYYKELEGHITKQNRKQFLDEYAERFLTEKRFQNPVVIVENAKNEEFEEAKRQIEDMRATIMELQSQLSASKDKIMALQDEKLALIEERGKNQLLLEMKDRTEKELQDTRQKLSETEKELGSFQKTIFGLYKRV